MKLYKIFCYIFAYIQQASFFILYGTKLKIGKGTTWRKRFNVVISNGGKIEIGDSCFFNNDCSINANISVKIGSHSIFGENIRIYDHNHRFRNRDLSIKQQGFKNEEVYIGENCWIGSNVVILKGTRIGDNCVISAGTVVKGIIPPNTILKTNFQYIYEKTDE